MQRTTRRQKTTFEDLVLNSEDRVPLQTARHRFCSAISLDRRHLSSPTPSFHPASKERAPKVSSVHRTQSIGQFGIAGETVSAFPRSL